MCDPADMLACCNAAFESVEKQDDKFRAPFSYSTTRYTVCEACGTRTGEEERSEV